MTNSKDRSDARKFKHRASALGAIVEYEADGDGRIYAVYENREVLPIGVTLASLASQSQITHAAFADAVYDATSDI